jgi:hypothetical protein
MSPVHGYNTQRGDHILSQHQQRRSTPSKVSLLEDSSQPYSHSPINLGASGGFFTDRPSSSAPRLKNVAPASITSESASAMTGYGVPPCKSVFEAFSGLNDKTILLASNGAAVDPGDVEQQFEHNESRLNCIPKRIDILASSALAPATPDRMHLATSRANAALSASDALSQEFHVTNTPSEFESIYPIFDRTRDLKAPITPSWVCSQMQKPRSRPVFSSIDSDCGSSSSHGIDADGAPEQCHTNFDIHPVITSVSTDTIGDVSSRFPLTIPMPVPVNTVPVILIRRGSSNDSSNSPNGCKSDVSDDLAITVHRTVQPEFHINRDQGSSVTTSNRQKLRSGIGPLRPTSAGGARKTVRPDLASGLGFKPVDMISQISSDTVRVNYSIVANYGLQFRLFRCSCLHDHQLRYLLVTRQRKKTLRTYYKSAVAAI